METRDIMIVNSVDMSKTTISTNATTLGELKRELDAKGINYEGMSFFEGISKTELKSDESQLPTNVNYKGTITNNLVFRLTKTSKKIQSGAYTRNELYSYIKENDLKSAFYNEYSKNYTNASTDILTDFVNRHMNKVKQSEFEKKNLQEMQETVQKVKEMQETQETQQECNHCCCDCVKQALLILVEDLFDSDAIFDNTYDKIKSLLGNVENGCSYQAKTDEKQLYSDSELNDLFKDF